jgi:DNA repair photolyase
MNFNSKKEVNMESQNYRQVIGITERGDAGLDHSWIEKAKKCDGVILITKAPQSLPKIPDNAIVHCTITGFGGGVLEPGVARPEITLDAYHEIVEEIGPHRTVLRIDPIIPTKKALATAREIFYHTESRVRISFIDAYRHVQERLVKAGLIEIPTDSLHFPLHVRKAAADNFPKAEVCGEPGFICTGCVSKLDLEALGLPQLGRKGGRQRASCACLASKTELLGNRGRCKHNCLYCYWR